MIQIKYEQGRDGESRRKKTKRRNKEKEKKGGKKIKNKIKKT